MIVGDDALGVPCGTVPFVQTKRLPTIHRGFRREQAPATTAKRCVDVLTEGEDNAHTGLCVVFCRDWRPRQSGPSGRPVPTGLHEQCGYVGLPQEGEGGPSKMVDEDVGSRFAGKCFGVRSFEGMRCSFVDRGSRAIRESPLRDLIVAALFAGTFHKPPLCKGRCRAQLACGEVGRRRDCSRFVCENGIVPRGLFGRPVPTDLCEQIGEFFVFSPAFFRE